MHRRRPSTRAHFRMHAVRTTLRGKWWCTFARRPCSHIRISDAINFPMWIASDNNTANKRLLLPKNNKIVCVSSFRWLTRTTAHFKRNWFYAGILAFNGFCFVWVKFIDKPRINCHQFSHMGNYEQLRIRHTNSCELLLLDRERPLGDCSWNAKP